MIAQQTGKTGVWLLLAALALACLALASGRRHSYDPTGGAVFSLSENDWRGMSCTAEPREVPAEAAVSRPLGACVVTAVGGERFDCKHGQAEVGRDGTTSVSFGGCKLEQPQPTTAPSALTKPR